MQFSNISLLFITISVKYFHHGSEKWIMVSNYSRFLFQDHLE